MAKVDSKGRIVLPQAVRDRLDITPGTEVEIREEDGKAVVEPEKEPDEIIARMDELIGEKRDVEDGPPSPTEHSETRPRSEHPDSIAQEFRENVRNGAEQATDE
ncbi:AbrB/MazE/SpoVT family DNA-binding domain-containing protein [Natronomonas marina]|uniref:AbrB/MazE/SpoVT family DNA-binding domain-containing protein n=1 Tax=Natronomonas marina TaxID=2961939 RepID=UPI0020C9A2F3|nr:AbrB/MazE/SpoVT family DNA-binding domain-containing protein [Natronomonas marina]